MHTVPVEIPKPIHPRDFEDMCVHVYGSVFKDKTPKTNGRPGQAQYGVDVYVEDQDRSERIGIQCKRYMDGKLTFKHVLSEVEAAEKGEASIARLIVATTADNDAVLLKQVQAFSDARKQAGKFSVDIEFWGDICRHIRRDGKLSRDYAPHEPGGVYQELFARFDQLAQFFPHLESLKLPADIGLALPGARPDSLNQLVTDQLDAIHDLIITGRYDDAGERLFGLGKNLAPFDDHQRARWHLQRGTCAWYQGDMERAALDLHAAADLYPDDEKMATARVRANLLQDKREDALAAADESLKRFPLSISLWAVYINAQAAMGHPIALSGVPKELRKDADILQILAWTRMEAGNLKEAEDFIDQAIQTPTPGFFARRAALAIALEAAASNPLKNAYSMIPPDKQLRLESALALFDPLNQGLWPVQSEKILTETVQYLVFANCLLKRFEAALHLVEEAEQRGLMSPDVMRAALIAHRDKGDIPELLRRGRDFLGQLDEQGLILVAEAAGNTGQLDLLELIQDRIKQCPKVDPETDHILEALNWVACCQHAEHLPAVLTKIHATDWQKVSSLYLMCAGVMVLKKAGEQASQQELLAHAVALSKQGGSDQERLLLADQLRDHGDYAQAATLYEPFTDPGFLSTLHARLLWCYVKSGNWHKARELIQSLPDNWTENDIIRSLALELGYKVGDWDFIAPLAEKELESAPTNGGAWLMRLQVALRSRHMHRFHQLLQSLPGELEGSPAQTAAIAQLELKYDHAESGMRRLYRLYRCNLDNLDAATQYFASIATESKDLPFMTESPDIVGAGCTVTLRSEQNVEIVLSIDPEEVTPVPGRDQFYPPDHPALEKLMGSECGSKVELPAGLGTSCFYTIVSITSVYRYLMAVAQNQFSRSLSSQSPVLAIPINQTEEGMDLTPFLDRVKEHRHHIDLVLNHYHTSPMTLGMLSQLVGRSVAELVTGWPAEAVPLFVCEGTIEQARSATALLKRQEATYVIDSATIAELTRLAAGNALRTLPKLVCSAYTRETLVIARERVRNERPSGSLTYESGAMRFIEYQEQDHVAKLHIYDEMIELLDNHCEVLPGYGAEGMLDQLLPFQPVLGEEEYSVLLLLAETGATLVTLDGRLAQLAKTLLNIDSVWPQKLLERALFTGHFDLAKYRKATLHQFLSHRNFVSLNHFDLLYLCDQGNPVLKEGLQRFKMILSGNDIYMPSALGVVLDFLKIQAKPPTQLKAFRELLGHLFEALLMNPKSDHFALLLIFQKLIYEVTKIEPSFTNIFPRHPDIDQERMEEIRHYLSEALRESIEILVHGGGFDLQRPIRLKTLVHTVLPRLVYDDNQ